MNKYNQLREEIIKANEDIAELKFGCVIIIPRGNSDKSWKIKTYITGHSYIPDRISRKLNKENIKFIPVLQEYRTKENELNMNIDIRVNNIKEIIGRDITLFDIKQCLIYNGYTTKEFCEIAELWKEPNSLSKQSDKLKEKLYEYIKNKNG